MERKDILPKLLYYNIICTDNWVVIVRSDFTPHKCRVFKTRLI